MTVLLVVVVCCDTREEGVIWRRMEKIALNAIAMMSGDSERESHC